MMYLFEHKFWGKTISEFISYIDSKLDKNWIWIDTETTGLRNSGYDVQLTQISCIVTKWNNGFVEVDQFNKKIKLTDTTLQSMKTHNIKRVLSFNHYGQKTKYYDEQNTVSDFYDFINQYPNSIFIIQNAEFDMSFLNTRNPNIKFKNEIIDTKQILQLFYLPLILKLAETDDFYLKMVQSIGTSDRDNGLISSSLSKVGPALGINMSGYHDALTDCRLMMYMFIKIFSALKNNTNVDIRKYQYERINSIK